MFRLSRSGIALILGGASALLGPSVHAAVQVSASLSGIGYELHALDVGATPQATFNALSTNTGTVSAETYVDSGATLLSSASGSQAVDGLLGTMSIQAVQPSSLASVVIGSGTMTDTVDVSASGQAAGVPGTTQLSNFYAVGGAPVGAEFTLSAQTSITFFATVSLQASTSVGLDAVTGQGEWGLASVSFYVDGTGATGTDYQSSEFYKDLFASYTLDAGSGNPLGENQSFNDVLAVTFYNNSNAAITGAFYAQVTASGESAATPVPEPESWALLLAGLAVVAPAAARRCERRRVSSQCCQAT